MPRRDKYRLLKRVGLCAECEVRKAEAGRVRCAECLRKHREYSRKYYERGMKAGNGNIQNASVDVLD